MSIALYLAMVFKLAAGIYAIQAPGVPVSFDRAAEYGVAAAYQGTLRGVDPFELAAIAREESDFTENMTGPDGKDCGITQTRITVSKYTCRQLKHSYWIAFHEAAREMSEYAHACRGHHDYDRCRFNHYNSGVRYARRGFHGRYWLRVQCFAAAARAGVDVGQACRHVRKKRDIGRLIAAGAAHRAGRRMLATAAVTPPNS